MLLYVISNNYNNNDNKKTKSMMEPNQPTSKNPAEEIELIDLDDDEPNTEIIHLEIPSVESNVVVLVGVGDNIWISILKKLIYFEAQPKFTLSYK